MSDERRRPTRRSVEKAPEVTEVVEIGLVDESPYVLKLAFIRTIAAFNVLLQERTNEIAVLEEKHGALREKVAALEERIHGTKEELKDSTGRIILAHGEIQKAKGKEEAVKEIFTDKKEERQHSTERWKIWGPIIMLVLSAVFSAVSVIANLILHALGAGGGGGH